MGKSGGEKHFMKWMHWHSGLALEKFEYITEGLELPANKEPPPPQAQATPPLFGQDDGMTMTQKPRT